ncbi:hypothetical protein AC579_4493 [Pseudocercospora musae]|uniref:Anaphase-promoting complex subunit 4 n=1 Tax=Pseudocercospora musae TaxID=113226 RepID=A0A139I657_9PEZI|nr:hypothetical protein AC579_4493 [Pseudocercospora musae]
MPFPSDLSDEDELLFKDKSNAELASKRLQTPITFPFTAFSHQHDLLAIVTKVGDEPQVQVFRIISGQLAYTIKRTDDDYDITSLAWKPDGTCLGIGWSDGKYGIYDGESGRQMSIVELDVEELEEEYALDLRLPKYNRQKEEAKAEMLSTVAALGFMGHVKEKSVEVKGTLTTDDWYEMAGDDDDDDDDGVMKQSKEDVVEALPRAIASLDVTQVLPRLSAIPAHGVAQPSSGPGANKFSSQLATDTQFETHSDGRGKAVDALLVCQKDRKVQVLLAETVKIGTCKIAGEPIMHAAHPQSSSHALLSKDEHHDSALSLTSLELPLEKLRGSLLHIIATNTKRIQTLMDYVLQTARCIQHDYTSNVMPPRKILGMLQDDLAKQHPVDGDAVTNLYHLAMTGSFHPQVLIWIDDYKDAFHRRWEQPINTMYSNIQNHIFVNLLPALDRFSIAVTTLRGQATYHEGSSSFDCSPQILTNILEHIDSLRLVAQKIQLVIMSEHREFRAFIKWLKMQVEIAAAEPFSHNALEVEERESPGIDYPLVLAYIKNNMEQSKLAPHIENRPDVEEGAICSEAQFFAKPLLPTASYELAKKALKQLDAKGGDTLLVKMKDVGDPMALLNIPALTCALMGRVRIALKRITEWQNRMLFPPFDPPSVALRWQGNEVLDMIQTKDSTLVVGMDRAISQMIEILSISPGPKSRQSISSGPVWNQTVTQYHLSGELLDVKFVTGMPDFCLCLVQVEGQTQVIRLRGEVQKVLHTFPADTTFRPQKLVVGGRKDKLLCVVFGNKGRDWRVLDLSLLLQGPGERGGDGMEVS